MKVPIKPLLYFALIFAVVWAPLDLVIPSQLAAEEEVQPIQKRSTTSLSPITPKAAEPKKIGAKGGKVEELPANEAATGDILGAGKPPSLLLQALVIVMMATMPFFIMLLSPFLKFVVVLSILRTAIGVQNSPPNMIINGVALMMSVFIMYPTAAKMYDAAQPVVEKTQIPDTLLSRDTPAYVVELVKAMKEPLKDFMKRNSSVRHQRLFYRMIYTGVPENFRPDLTPTDFVVLVPSFITGQLKEAFEIAVVIYIPFFVIDLVVSNILLAMGMMMLSPVTISMPLKLFLLVMLDGWTLLIEGLVQTFRG